MQNDDKKTINELFTSGSLADSKSDHWAEPNIGFNLTIFATLKILLTALSISCPIPCGVFTPIFCAGAAIGRLLGYFMFLIFGLNHMGIYAVVGAAALTASVTHTLSVVVIVFELTGQINYMLPLLIAVIISHILSQGLSMSIYDVLLDMKGLPYLPALRSQDLYDKNAIDLMSTDYNFLTFDSNLRDIGKVI
jgi:chloride channel 2